MIVAHSFISSYLTFVFLSHIVIGQQEPVNRFFTAASSELQPELECLVGINSASISEIYKVKCTEAWNISVKYDRKTANSFAADKYISEHDRRLRTIRLESLVKQPLGWVLTLSGLAFKAVD